MAILGTANPIKIFWHNPDPIFVARVNMPGTVSYPVQDIRYDGVTTGSYTDLAADMFFTLGDAPGNDSYGRGRLRAAPTATVLKVGRSSEGYEDGQLSIVDDSYITVYLDFRIHMKVPVIGGDYNEYKDTDLAVGDLTEFPPPIANLGADFAGSIDPDTETLTVYFAGSNSIAVADGATITDWAWTAPGGTFVNGTSATDADVYIEFPAGVYWVSLTVTDSNGKMHSGRRLVLADDPADSLCVSGMQAQNFTRDQVGSSVRLRVLQALPRADYPDGAHIIIWEDRPSLDGVSRDHILFTGWHQTDQASARALETHLQRDTMLTCVDAAGRLDALPGFPQRVEVPTEADLSDAGMNWGYMPSANMDKFLCYLIHWHSTAASVADFYPSGTWDEYPFVLFDSGGATLYEQLQRQASRIVPDHNFTCDRFGALRVEVNPQYQRVADRTSTIQNSLTDQSWSEISFEYTRPPRVHTTRGSALLTQTEWVIDDDDEKQLLTPLFSIAPGSAPGQGARENNLGERLAKSQEDLNDCVGHHHAYSNSRYSPIQVTLNLNADPWDFDPAAFTWVFLAAGSGLSAVGYRGVDFESVRCLPVSVSIDYSYGEEATTWRGRVTLEMETIGLPALTEEQEEALPVGEQPAPPYVPDFGLVEGQQLLAAIDLNGNLYRTSDFQTVSGSGGPTWAEVDLGISETLYSFVVDPFSPGYIAGAGAINGWIATETDIYRVTDMFGTVGVTSVHSFATSANAGSFHWRTVQASFGAYFAEGSNPWLLCVSYYGDTAGHAGTWATYSVDGGATWATEVQVSEYYDLSTVTRFAPIGVYTSPKTPGLAYTAAFVETGLADGFVSYDWGETWQRLSSEPVDDPAQPLPRWGMWDDAGVFHLLELGARRAFTLTSQSPGDNNVQERYLIAPPATAVRVELEAQWSASLVGSGNGSSAYTFGAGDIALTRTTLSGSYTGPTINTSTGGTFLVRWTRIVALGGWEADRPSIELAPPASPNDGAYVRNQFGVTLFGGPSITATMRNLFRITEIELADGTIYSPPDSGPGFIQPGQGNAGSIHLPWPDNASEQLAFYGALDKSGNREFRLLRAEGDLITDVSPSDGSRSYGINRYGFAIRTHDSNRQYVLAAVIGNDSSADPDDDYHAVYISDDGGDTWTEVVAPVADSSAPSNRPAFEAAFAGDTHQVFWVWGTPGYIGYSHDFGVSVDDRSGDLGSYSPGGFIGIAGGPNA